MIIGFVDEFNKNDTYKAAVKLSGQLHAMADACGWDDYWTEKMMNGKRDAEFKLSQVISKQDES